MVVIVPIGCLLLLLVGCGDDAPQLADGGMPDAGHPHAGLVGFDGSSLSCGAAIEAPDGYERCQTGALRRLSPSTCSSSVPRAEAVPGNFPGIDECDHDSDCSDLPLGHCAQREGGIANACVAGCLSDSDCGDGKACLCGEPVGRCIPSGCRSNADCESGHDCVLYDAPDGCLPRRLACQTANDECVGSEGCDGYSVNATFCVRGPENSACSIAQCTQP